MAIKLVIGIILIIIGFVAFTVIQPMAFLPHEKIVISAPFDKNDPPDGLIPMGETLFHPKPQVPNGHPGIDFGWQHNANILSSSDGVISYIKQTPEHYNNWDIGVKNGPYELRYKELQDYNQSLKVGVKVKKDDFIGHPGHFADHYQLHWELASVSLFLDRWCPMSYFDEESRKTMEDIWAKVPPEASQNMKKQFPDICSGDYFGKEEK